MMMMMMIQGCHWEVGARDFSWLLSWESRGKIESKENPSFLISTYLLYLPYSATWNLSDSPDNKL